MRIHKVRFLVESAFLILLARIFFLQVVKGDFYYSLSSKNCIRVMPFEGIRGRILDRNGEAIVDNHVAYNISVMPREFRQNADTLPKLAALLGKTANQINKIIKKDFISSFAPVTVAKDVDKKTAIAIEERKFVLPGVMVEIMPKRSYPYGETACHITGYLGKMDLWMADRLKGYGYKSRDLIGFSGVEEGFEPALRALEGGTQIQVDHRGRLNKVLSFRPPTSGKDVYLTVDIRIQKALEDAFSGKIGAAVLLEPASGRVIALVSSPGFYPGAFIEEGKSSYVRALLSRPDSPMLNRAISGRYPLGSIFKAVSAVAALENKKITADKRFFCPGKMPVGIKEFNCWSVHDSQDLIEAISHSCNVYFYHLALLLGPDKLSEYAIRFGLGRQSGIELPYETSGNVPSRLGRRMQFKNWYDGDTANFGIGQGELLVSPLQAARIMAVFANGGKLVRPYIVEKIAGQELNAGPPYDLGLDKETLRIVALGLREVANSVTGTANIGDWQGLKISGKTGTAQVQNKLSHGWFAGFFPYDRPKVAFCIFLENTGPSAHAVVLAHQIFTRMQEEGLI